MFWFRDEKQSQKTWQVGSSEGVYFFVGGFYLYLDDNSIQHSQILIDLINKTSFSAEIALDGLADSVDYDNDFKNDDNHVLSKPQEVPWRSY